MNIEEFYPQRASRQFTSIASEMHEEMKRARKPELKAMLRNSADVLNNLAKKFSDYEVR